ncbi:MAG TPA: VanW family protein [Fimbriimonadaceae bacterium]|nr:VanW family protein [Fimbriimonadaceae bacterium]
MKKVLIVALSVLAAFGAFATIVAARFEPTIVPNTYVGIVNVGGLTKQEAAKKVRIWWETQRVKKLELQNKLLKQPLPPMTPGTLGVTVDDEGSVADLPMSDLVEAVTEKVGGSPPEQKKFPVRYKAIQVPLDELKKRIQASVGEDHPARVVYQDGAIVRRPEVSGFVLDDKQLADAVIAGLASGSVELPLQEAPKALPDDELAKITDVVSEYSTSFPSYQTSRNTNIRLAAAKLNGCVLMPGQQLSFNDTVGRRTAKGGFREAPVLKNGKHDHDIGGGICQVSTTLYNAALLADMKIVRRNNHSLPSAYVALGRDATVDWGNLDLVIENSSDKPVAVASNYKNGRITFRILGQKDPSISIKIETANHKAWDRGTDMVVDKSLKPGTRTVVEKGSRGHSIDTYRIIYKDGVEVRRELLNHSIYAGCPRTIAYNPTPEAPKPGIRPPGTVPPVTSPPPVAVGHG